MKTKFLRMVLPVFAFVLAITVAFANHAQGDKEDASYTQAFVKVIYQGQPVCIGMGFKPCSPTGWGPVCTWIPTGDPLFGWSASESNCGVPLYYGW